MQLRDAISAFLESANYSDNTKTLYRNRLLRLSKWEDKIQKPIYEFSADEMQRALNDATTSPQVWTYNRNTLFKYFDWLSTQGIDVSNGSKSLSLASCEELKEDLTKGYIYSAHQLVARINGDIDYIVKNEDQHYSTYRMVVCAIILLWLGFKLKEIVKVKKLDISSPYDKPNTIMKDGKRIEVDSILMGYLIECVNAEFFLRKSGAGRGKMTYVPSGYLLRTCVSDRIDVSSLTSMITLFNAHLPKMSAPYHTEKIYWSGIFLEAYNKEVTEGFPRYFEGRDDRIRFYRELFKDDKMSENTIKHRIKEYELYTSVLRNKEL